jgi:hypothetical protein
LGARPPRRPWNGWLRPTRRRSGTVRRGRCPTPLSPRCVPHDLRRTEQPLAPHGSDRSVPV